MKTTRTGQLLPLGKFETSFWAPVIRRRPTTARRAPALPTWNRRPGLSAAALAALLLAAWQGGAR